MTRVCKVCKSFHRKELEKRIIFMKQNGETYEQIAKEYENISPHSLKRHALNHMKNVARAIQGDSNELEIDSDSMFSQAEIDSWRCYKTAMDAGDMAIAQKALSNALELTKMREKRDENKPPAPDPTMIKSIKQTPEWHYMLNKIYLALKPYPDALEAFLDSIEYEDMHYVEAQPLQPAITEDDDDIMDILQGPKSRKDKEKDEAREAEIMALVNTMEK